MICLRPGGFAAPEERWCRIVSNGFSQTRGCRFSGANPLLAHVAGDPLYCSGDGKRHPIQTHGSVLQAPYRACRCRRNSCEAARHVKRFALLQNVEARPCQLVRQRLDRHHVVCLGFLAFVEPFGLGAEAQREVGRFDEGPGQVLVAVLGVAFAFLLAVADALAIDAARVGGEVADVGEAVDRPRLQQDRGRQHAADARHAGEQGVLRSLADAFLQTLFKQVDLRAQRGDDRDVALDRQSPHPPAAPSDRRSRAVRRLT